MVFQPVREHDSSGRLVAAGYEWVQHKDTPGIPLHLVAYAGLVAAALGVWVGLVGDMVVGTPIVMGGLAAAFWSRWALKKFGHDRQAIVFRSNDTVTTLGGPLPVKVSEIVNVSNDVQFETVYVFFGLRDGGKIRAVDGRGLEHDEGLLVYEELAKAWQEMRGAMAVAAVTRPRAS